MVYLTIFLDNCLLSPDTRHPDSGDRSPAVAAAAPSSEGRDEPGSIGYSAGSPHANRASAILARRGWVFPFFSPTRLKSDTSCSRLRFGLPEHVATFLLDRSEKAEFAAWE